jgi:gluconolactonase
MEVKKIAENFAFPEGPAYDGKGGVLVSNCNGNTINKINKDGNAVAFTSDPKKYTFGKSNGLAFGDDNALYACDFGRNAILRIFNDGRTELYADKYGDQSFKGPNDLAFDPEGNLYITDPAGSDTKNPIGCVYRIEKESRRVTKIASGMAFPNGIAPDGKIARTITLPGSDVTNLDFGGKDYKTLYITEAKTGALYTIEVEIGGLPLFRAPQNEVK